MKHIILLAHVKDKFLESKGGELVQSIDLNLTGKVKGIYSSKVDAIEKTVKAINEGKIVAVKGLGGFHLVVDAGNTDAVASLRERKHREEKPFALMYPNLDLIKQDCFVSQKEESTG